MAPGGRLDVEEADVLGVSQDEATAGLDVLSHEYGEQLVCLRRVVERYLKQDPTVGIHRGVPQLLGRHLAQALEPHHAFVLTRIRPARRETGFDQLVTLPL